MLTKKENWSELIKLNMENLDECIALQDTMLKHMEKNKEHTCSYIGKREEKDFKYFLEHGEMFGIKNINTNKLIAILRIEPLDFDKITKYLSYNGTFCMCEELLEVYKKYSGVYLSCLMTDLDTRNIGLGKYIVHESELYAKNTLLKDYSLCDIHVKHRASYRLFSTFFAFAISNKIITRIGVNNKKFEIPVFYLCSVYNEHLHTKLQDSIVYDKTINNMLFSNNIVQNMFQNRTSDQVLNKNQLLIFNGGKISKVELKSNKLI